MASALAAFAQQAERALPATEETEAVDEVLTNSSGHEEDTVTTKKKTATSNDDQGSTSLAAFAATTNSKPRKVVSLVDVAKQQQHDQDTHVSPKAMSSLLEVARAGNVGEQGTRPTLTDLAAQVNKEDAESKARRSHLIQKELESVSAAVKEDHEHRNASHVILALQSAVADEQAYQEEAFEDDAIEHAATILASVAKDTKNPHSNGQPPQIGPSQRQQPISVDRHVLKQRQAARGLKSKSTSKAKTMKEQLSSFQFDQLSLTQRRLFVAMLAEERRPSGTRRCNMHKIEELSMNKAERERQRRLLNKRNDPSRAGPQYAKLDDQRHCRFKPRLRSSDNQQQTHGGDSDDDGDNQRTEDFIRRMEATERVRNEQLRRTRAEREYNARIDKKECPTCGNPQSYAELTQKRKKCPNCGVTYRSRLAWSEIADEFLARMAAHLQARLEARRAAQAPEGNQRQAAKAPTWQEVQDAFLGRVQLDLEQRQMTKEIILRELEAEYTFTPVISARAKRLQLGDFDDRLRRDLEARRLRQEQYERLAAAIARAESDSPNQQPLARDVQSSRVHRPMRPFEERLREDIERRQQRSAMHDNNRRHRK